MASEILGLFTTPDQYQLAQQQAQQAEAAKYAQLDPRAQAQYGFYRGGQQLTNAIGGALGIEDPQLKMITQRQQLIKMVDPSNPDSFAPAIEMALQTGDTQAAYLLRNGLMEAKQQAQEQQINQLKTQDYLIKRGQGMQAQGMENIANELIGQIKNPDGTINETVKAQLLSFPQGRAAISELAKVVPDLRRIGAMGAVEDNPFTQFIQDPTIPANVKTLANQYSNSLTKGILDPEKADAKVKELTDMTQRIQQFEQNQAQIKSNQAQMAAFKQQGLENSQAYLAIAQSNNALAQQNAAFNRQMKLDDVSRKKQEAEEKKEAAKNKPLPVQLQRDESKDLELVDSYAVRAETLLPSIQSLTPDPRTKKAPLELGPVNNLQYLAQNAAGNSTTESRAYAALQRAVQEATNLKTDAAKGVQTDKDVLRFANELIAAFGKNDTKTTLDALNNFYKSTKRAQEDTKKRIDSRRTSQGVQPYYGDTLGTTKNPIKLD